MDLHLRHALGGQGARQAGVDQCALGGQQRPGYHVLAALHHVVPTFEGGEQGDAGFGELRALKIDHAVRALGNLGPGHQMGGLARLHGQGRHLARRDGLGDLQGHGMLPAGLRHVRRPQGIAVVGGAVKGRHVFRRGQIKAQHAPGARRQRHALGLHRRRQGQEQIPRFYPGNFTFHMQPHKKIPRISQRNARKISMPNKPLFSVSFSNAEGAAVSRRAQAPAP